VAYIGISQIGNMMMTEEQLYEFALHYAQQHGKHDAFVELQKLGPPPHQTKSALETVIKWSHEFGGGIHAQTRPEDLLTRAFASPQYSLLDDIDILRGADFSSKCLWRESYHLSLFRRAPRLEVPIYFFAGRHDYAVTATVAHSYFEALEAPRGKEFVWFENSSHFPNFEEPEKFQRIMKRIAHTTGE
jgi:pimeloyl-ACP methyl ester carboxylesterase